MERAKLGGDPFMASSCVLRATGKNFQPSDFLQDSTFQPCHIFHKNEPKSASSVRDTSGITLDISSKDEFSEQVREAIIFIEANKDEFLRLKQFNGVEELSLDFGVNKKDCFLQSYLFPLNLLDLASKFAIELELSIYN